MSRIANALNLKKKQVRGTVDLLDEENTVPFITRYRKEKTGGLDEEKIRSIQRLLTEYRELEDRRGKVLHSISEQGKLTDDLRAAIEAADSLKRLEELYAPFKSKRKTRADEAREIGLGPLADAIWSGRVPDSAIETVAGSIVGKHPKLESCDAVRQGVIDILAAQIAENVEVRDVVRSTARKSGVMTSKLVESSKHAKTFQDYNGFSQAVDKLPPHRVLALDRGEDRKALKVSVEWDQELARTRIAGLLDLRHHVASEFLSQCVNESLKRLINPSIERELRREATEAAQQHAIDVFSANLRQLLLQPPLLGKKVLAIDPGYRTGCKVVVLDEGGTPVADDVLQLTKSEALTEQREKFVQLVQDHGIEVVAIGNATASRETQEFVSGAIQECQLTCRYVIVNEAGASIYSASDAGREEFPELDATVRGTISIGRRLQDPLSELVKIEPRHIGVGMYQHDVAEKHLKTSLDDVVESCVNTVGVDLNQASAELLKYVSGLNRSTAKAIVSHRQEHGPFQTRKQLLDVSGIGDATFTQAAGFLRIREGDDPLDATWVHPESYPIAERLLTQAELPAESLRTGRIPPEIADRIASFTLEQFSGDFKTDAYTFSQVLESLLRPGRDPRDELPQPLLRTGVLTIDDLAMGMELNGTVTNVVDFGAFVDVGLKNDGLIHISKMSTKFVSSPLDIVAVGQPVTVWVDSIDKQRERVGLTMLKPAE
ncbi:MAG: RNA-binding transcriptional accessory protein [Planctomycetaceae bacterium]|nr:RNA-binding transcriptional accessory protein [Planctomycetaceae bacterium]